VVTKESSFRLHLLATGHITYNTCSIRCNTRVSSIMSAALRRSTRSRTSYDRAERANDGCPLFELMAVVDYREVLCDEMSYALLSRFRVSRAMRR